MTKPNISTTPEFSFLLSLCQYKLGQNEQQSAIKTPQNIDWPLFFKTAARHHLIAIVASVRDSIPDLIPPEHLALFQKSLKSKKLKMLSLATELQRVHHELRSRDIPVISLKGPVLALQLYNDPAARSSIDLDILVPSIHLDATRNILMQIGYTQKEPSFELSPKQFKYYQKTMHDFGFEHKVKKVQLEVHWSLFKNRRLLPISNEVLFKEAVSWSFGNTEINGLNVKHEFLYLLAHGAKHFWMRLSWLYEMNIFIEKHKLEHKGLQLAKEFGLEKAWYYHQYLSHKLFHSNISGEVKDQIEVDSNYQNMLALSIEFLTADRLTSESYLKENKLKQFLIRAKNKDSINYKLNGIQWISVNDFKYCKLPDQLFPLYYILRPFLWIIRYSQKALTI